MSTCPTDVAPTKGRIIEDTAIIIPAHNEEAVIKNVIIDVQRLFKYVVAVSDGSTDATCTEAKSAKAIVIDHQPFGLGQGGALQTGIEYALGLPVDYFVTFDADGQHQVEDVIKMRDEIKKTKVDIVMGSRFLGEEPRNMTRAKRVMLKAAVIFSNITSGIKLTDAHNGLRIFNRHVAQSINLEEPGYQHASEITEKIKKNGYSYKEIPVKIIYTDYSKSKGQSIFNVVNLGTDIIMGKIVK